MRLSGFVVPLAGTWIETYDNRGLTVAANVVPLAGTWIETSSTDARRRAKSVVPLAGTWIETTQNVRFWKVWKWSFPLRERGLKRQKIDELELLIGSFPLRERGLKLGFNQGVFVIPARRSPCGNVD